MTLEELIQKSKLLRQEEKQFYLFLATKLPKSGKDKLKKIFEAENFATEKADTGFDEQRTEINKRFLADMKIFYKVEHKAGVQSEENEEKISAENLLKDLNKQ